MHVNEGGKEDATHVLLLSIIEKMNKNSINPDKDDLLKRVKVFQSHLDYLITTLLDKGYIDKETNWQRYNTYAYSITEKGMRLLEAYRTLVKNFMLSIMELYRNKEKERLYNELTENRDLLWFGFYEGFLKKEELQDITSFLDVDMKYLWWDKSSQKWADIFFDGYGPM